MLAAALLAAFGGALSSGCASTRTEAQWTDPRFAGHSLRGATVLVACSAEDVAVKRICEDAFSARVKASGATPVTGTGGDSLAAARSAGASAILATSVTPAGSIVTPGPTFGVGIGSIGGSGGWGGGTAVGGGVGVSVPVGGAGVSTAYSANVVLTDVTSGEMMWTSKLTAPASQDVGGQIEQLAQAGMEAARKAGLF